MERRHFVALTGLTLTAVAHQWLFDPDRAFELLARSVPENEPPWIYWFTEADAQALAGWSLLALGRPGEAEPHLRRAVALLDPTFTRDRAGMLCDLATAPYARSAAVREFGAKYRDLLVSPA